MRARGHDRGRTGGNPQAIERHWFVQHRNPVETNDDPFYRFTREINDEEPITARFPEATLDLINTVTPQVLTRPPCELPQVLAAIAETDPAPMSDYRYLRLIDLVEQS